MFQYKDDIEKCVKLVYIVVEVLPNWKLQYILKFLKYNIKIDDFKQLILFPLNRSWTGSEIPIILNDISFLNTLKNKLSGIEYLDHKNFLEECCDLLKKRQNEVELQEYIMGIK